ncbi:MAG: tetratricopeptide repeat protein [Rhodothermales bacterium]
MALLVLLSACGPDRTVATESAADALARGDSAFQQLQFAQAARDYSTAIQLDSTLAQAFLMRGQVRWMGQQYESAVDDLNRALDLDSSLAWGYFFRGSSYLSLDSLTRALDDLQIAAAAAELPDEDRARAHRLRAIVHMSTDRYGEGVDAISEAIELQPDLAYYVFERGLLNAAAERPEAAAADLERFLAMDTTANENTAFARAKLDSLRAARPDIQP